jgi:hypothetical protein
MTGSLKVLVIQDIQDEDVWLEIFEGLGSKVECVYTNFIEKSHLIPRLRHWSGTPGNEETFYDIFHAKPLLTYARLYADHNEKDWFHPLLKTFPEGLKVLDIETPCCGDYSDVSDVLMSPAVRKTLKKLCIRSTSSVYWGQPLYAKDEYDTEYETDALKWYAPAKEEYILESMVIWGDPNGSDYDPLVQFMKKCKQMKKVWFYDFYVDIHSIMRVIETWQSLEEVKWFNWSVNSVIETICKSAGMTIKRIFTKSDEFTDRTLQQLARLPNLNYIYIGSEEINEEYITKVISFLKDSPRMITLETKYAFEFDSKTFTPILYDAINFAMGRETSDEQE